MLNSRRSFFLFYLHCFKLACVCWIIFQVFRNCKIISGAKVSIIVWRVSSVTFLLIYHCPKCLYLAWSFLNSVLIVYNRVYSIVYSVYRVSKMSWVVFEVPVLSPNNLNNLLSCLNCALPGKCITVLSVSTVLCLYSVWSV